MSRLVRLCVWGAVLYGTGLLLGRYPEFAQSVFRPAAVGLTLSFCLLVAFDKIRLAVNARRWSIAALWVGGTGAVIALVVQSFVGRAIIAGHEATVGVAMLLGMGLMATTVALYRRRQRSAAV